VIGTFGFCSLVGQDPTKAAEMIIGFVKSGGSIGEGMIYFTAPAVSPLTM
jgi:hypothetical protein